MKKRVLYINSVCGFGSTGNIVADLSKSTEYESLVCFGRKKDYAGVNSYKFANFFDNSLGALRTIFFDNNLSICSRATNRLIKKIKEYNPDIIHLHNLHGYYVNVEMLFKFLKEYNKPVIWTLHDCWSMTGYCPHFDFIKCDKYKTKCLNCPYGLSYPFSIFKQNVERDFEKKKYLFNDLDNLTIVTPSKWLKRKVEESFIANENIHVINNGVDIKERYIKKNSEFTILAVANHWTQPKGKDELKKIIPLLNEDIQVVIVGRLNDKDHVFEKCKLINNISDREKLLEEYSKAHIFINPTLSDTFPTVNIESLLCGTPVLTYDTGGSSEPINSTNGLVIPQHNYTGFANAINNLKNNYTFDTNLIKQQSKKYDKKIMLQNYFDLYNRL